MKDRLPLLALTRRSSCCVTLVAAIVASCKTRGTGAAPTRQEARSEAVISKRGGHSWVQTPAPRYCQRTPADSGLIAIPPFDSAGAVEALRTAPETPFTPDMYVSRVIATGEGYLIRVADTATRRPGWRGLDGTATAYVTEGPCVVYLGW